MDFTDQLLTCNRCGTEFVFTSDEQRFFHEKQFTHPPKRCFRCRAACATGQPFRRRETIITCAECGKRAVVPFKPVHNTPVLCRTCFDTQREPNAVQFDDSLSPTRPQSLSGQS
jgi:CxxC-x17-CxxC domain-containing protein